MHTHFAADAAHPGLQKALERLAEVSPLRSSLALMAGDMLTILACALVCLALRAAFGGNVPLGFYASYWPFFPLFAVTYAFLGLYPGFTMPPHLEIKKTTSGTTVVVLTLVASGFFSREAEELSRLVVLGFWASTVGFVPLTRLVLRRRLALRPWWGRPVVVFGRRDACRENALALAADRSSGLVPVAMATGELREPAPYEEERVSVEDLFSACNLREVELPPLLDEQTGLSLAGVGGKVAAVICPAEGESSDKVLEALTRLGQSFRVVLFPPMRSELMTLGLSVAEISHRLVFRAEQKLLDPTRMALKRLTDVVLVVLTLPLWLAALGVIAVLIRLDSKGPVFYGHRRIGRYGHPITLWKFRSMIPDADKVLARYLEEHPELAGEWALYHKLRDDPRITRVGRWLRNTSLDELPQLVNVLVGDISLVGPRPIVEDEVERYQEAFELYKLVRGGLTGLWQVSGRSETSYERRVALDEYYIRNWSIWLDLWVLAKTPWAVLSKQGSC